MENLKKFFSVVWFYVCVCYKKYFDFKGRARRKEYWSFFLFSIIVGVLIQVVLALTGLDLLIKLSWADIVLSESPDILSWVVIVFSFVFNLTVIGIPSIAVFFRRVHDVGHSCIWEFCTFLVCIIIPIFLLVYIVLMLYDGFKDSQPGENDWGENPKGITNAK